MFVFSKVQPNLLSNLEIEASTLDNALNGLSSSSN